MIESGGQEIILFFWEVQKSFQTPPNYEIIQLHTISQLVFTAHPFDHRIQPQLISNPWEGMDGLSKNCDTRANRGMFSNIMWFIKSDIDYLIDCHRAWII